MRLRDWHHVSGVPDNEIGEAATFGVVPDQLSSSVRKYLVILILILKRNLQEIKDVSLSSDNCTYLHKTAVIVISLLILTGSI